MQHNFVFDCEAISATQLRFPLPTLGRTCDALCDISDALVTHSASPNAKIAEKIRTILGAISQTAKTSDDS